MTATGKGNKWFGDRGFGFKIGHDTVSVRLKSILCVGLVSVIASVAFAQTNPGTSPLSGRKGGTGNAFMQFTGPASSIKTFTLPNATDTIATLGAIQTFTATKTFNSGTFILGGSSSGTTTLNAAAAAAGTITLPAATDTLVGKATTDTLTNKTIDGDDNALSDIGTAALKTRTGQDSAVATGTAGTSGDLALWNADGDLVDGPTPPTGTIVGTSDTQTLTNKAIDGDDNTVTDLPASALKTGAIGDVINGLTEDTSPEGAADYVVTYDASDGGPKKVLLNNLPGGGGGGSSALPPGFIYGLTVSNNAVDATNDIDIAAGKARSDGDSVDITVAAALTKQLDAAWVEGGNAGCLDTGSIADGTYHIFVIRNSGNADVDVLCSTSAAAPTMPSGYDAKRRNGSIVRASGSIVAFSQNDTSGGGVKILLDASPAAVAATVGTSASTMTLARIPAGIKVDAIVNLHATNTGAAAGVLISPLEVSDQAPSNDGSSPGATIIVNNVSGGRQVAQKVNILTNTSGQVRARSTAASTTVNLVTLGWVDDRLP